MNLAVIPIIIGDLGFVTKNLEKRLDELDIKEESWRVEEICCHSDFSITSPVSIAVKNLQSIK